MSMLCLMHTFNLAAESQNIYPTNVIHWCEIDYAGTYTHRERKFLTYKVLSLASQ